MKTKQDYLNLLEETVNYYTIDKNKTAFDEVGSCSYYFKGNMCAVGRCLIRPQGKDKALGDQNTAKSLLNKYSQRVFKKQYRGFNTSFWELLQEFHDSADHISNFELTIEGKKRYKIIEKWIEDNK